MIIRTILLAMLPALLTGCAAHYGPASMLKGGGYKNQEIEPGIHKVTFTGNGYTSEKRAATFTIYRCAEITTEKGARHFVFLEGQSGEGYNTSGGLVGILIDANRTKKAHSLTETARTLLRGEEPQNLQSVWTQSGGPTSTALIRLLKEKSEKYPASFDAQEVLDKLRPAVKGK